MKIILMVALFVGSIFASSVSKEACVKKGENFIFAGNECINYAIFEGDDNERLNIIVHGTWDEGSNTLGRYAPFAETLNMETDITTIAVALPGYSKSSLNKLKSIGSKKYNHQASSKEYIYFLNELFIVLKKRYESKSLTFIGHSAGAMMGASLAGYNPKLLDNIVLVAGRYSISKRDKTKTILAEDVINKMSKKAKFLLIYGVQDKISLPKVTKDFYNKSLEAGLNVKLVEVKEGGHIDLDMTDTSVEAITELLEEE